MSKFLLICFSFCFFFVTNLLAQNGSSSLPIQTIGIDFDNWKNNTPAYWNKINNYNTGSIINDLINQEQTITGYAMEVTSGFNGSGASGLSTGDNSGPVPDAVMGTFWYNQNGQAVLTFTLDKTKRYKFRFYGGRDGNNDDKSADYTIGETTVTLYNWNNIQNEAIIDNVFPDTNNEVVVTINASQGYTYAILNGIILEEYAAANSSPIMTAVADQSVGSEGQLTVPLSASDSDGDSLVFSVNSSADFISLSDHSNSAAVLIASPGAGDIGTYNIQINVSDGKGGEDSKTFVITVENQNTSSSPLQVIGIDFDNWKNNTPANWNKINSYGSGSIIDHLINQQQIVTDYNMEVADDFNGSGPSGLSTGDDSGPVPDAVMGTFWYNQHDQAALKFTLDKSKRYRFRFYGGRDGNNDDKSADYTIGETAVTLYNWNNTENEVVIDNVFPDENNEVTVTVKASQGYTYAILNSIVIEEYDHNVNPVLAEVPDQTVTSGEQLSIPISASDINGDSLSFSVSSIAFVSIIEPKETTATLLVVPGVVDVGSFSIELSASDRRGGVGHFTFELIVVPQEELVLIPPDNLVENRPKDKTEP